MTAEHWEKKVPLIPASYLNEEITSVVLSQNDCCQLRKLSSMERETLTGVYLNAVFLM